MSKYKAVIFDVDGTLLDTIEGLTFSVNYSLEQFGYQGKDNTFIKKNTGHGIRHLLKNAFDSVNADVNLAEATKLFLEHYDKTCNAGSAPFPGIYDLLLNLKNEGLKLATASNKAQEAVQVLNEHFFKDIELISLGETETQRRKPEPDMLLIAMNMMGVKPNETLFVGDQVWDYQAGKTAGCDTALVAWGFCPKEILLQEAAPDFFANSVQELRKYILN